MNIQNFSKRIYYTLYKRHIFGITSGLRVLPDFIIIGVGRGGTTSLYHYLGDHPCMVKSAYDELGFFDTNYDLGTYWYRSLFPTIFTKNKIVSKLQHFMTYDATPSYIRHPWIAKRILQSLSGVKLITILRNPVDKTYSHYHMGVRDENEKRTFEEAIDFDLKFIEQNKDLPKDQTYFEKVVEKSYIARGFYAEQLQNWFNSFSKEQILIISTEELATNPDKTLSTIFRFLGLPDHKIKDLTKRNEAKYPPMNPETREILSNYFKPYNEKLYSLIGKDFGWE